MVEKMNKAAKIGIGIVLFSLFLSVIFWSANVIVSFADNDMNQSSSISLSSDMINITFDSNSSYIWIPQEKININKINISGYLKGDSAKISVWGNEIYSYGYDHNLSAVNISSGSGEISLLFDYGNDYGYDDNNDGISYISDIIDFNVNANFSDNLSYDNLCTKYIINNLDENISDNACYGSSECCLFLNMESLGNWNDSFYLNYGKYDSGYNNTVSAQIVYYDVNLSDENLHSNIYNSQGLELRADFVDSVYFDAGCSYCNLSDDNYTIDINVNGLLHISNISYGFEYLNQSSLSIIDSALDENIWSTKLDTYGIGDLIISSNDSLVYGNLYCGSDLINASVVIGSITVPYDAYAKAARIKEIEDLLR